MLLLCYLLVVSIQSYHLFHLCRTVKQSPLPPQSYVTNNEKRYSHFMHHNFQAQQSVKLTEKKIKI
jgi:hypothetical protein